MKKYEAAKLEITEFEAEDVITTSGASGQSLYDINNVGE